MTTTGPTRDFGGSIAVKAVAFARAPGARRALIGPTGAGKTALIGTLMGIARQRGGTIRLNGRPLDRLPPEARAVLGLGWVPLEPGVFRSLTAEEDLTAVARPGRRTLPAVYGLFPRLAERRANRGGQLPGGEQQMLAMARALMLKPRLLPLDEPVEGLAPVIVQAPLAAIRRIVREEGVAAVIVEQHAGRILPITDRAVILERGRIVHAAPSADLLRDAAALERHPGAAAH